MNRDVSRRTVRHRRAPAMLAAAAAIAVPLAASSTASAQTARCGAVITSDTTLTQNVGPCPGNGLIIGADHVTLDLNGHSVTGDPQARQADSVGVLFRGVRSSKVLDGTVQQFDAGVAVTGGGGNTVRGITARDNVNYRVITGVNAQPNFEDNPPDCDYGDGITTTDSSGNRITRNRAIRNGPFSGISLVGDSDGNRATENVVRDNDVVNVSPNGASTICGAGASAGGQGPMPTGRPVQDIGIRVEGPDADRNRVVYNVVQRNALIGIAIHPFVCHMPPPDGPMPGPVNDHNVIAGNHVTDTGLRTHDMDEVADGIAVLENGPAGVVCPASENTIRNNVSSHNFRDGIQIGGRGSHDNTVTHNVTNDNVRDGLRVFGPEGDVAGVIDSLFVDNAGHGNGEYDGADMNPDCGTDKWRASKFGTVNQPCVNGRGG